MHIFVTGATGFIGSHFCESIVGHKVVALVHDNKQSKWLSHALEKTVKVRGNILDQPLLEETLVHYEIDTVVHLAALSIVRQANKIPIQSFNVNVMGTAKLLEACRRTDMGNHIIIQSTDKVYGEKMGATAKDTLSPTEPYGSSKICSDIVAQTYMEHYGLPITITRPCNVYGYDLNSRIIPNTIIQCLKGKPPIIYEGVLDLRQYIHVHDLVDAFSFILDHNQYGIANIASHDILNQEEVVKTIMEFFPKIHPIYTNPPILKEIASQYMAPNWQAKRTFKERIGETIEAFKKYGF